MLQTCWIGHVAQAGLAIITCIRLLSGVGQDMPVKPALLSKLQSAVSTPVQTATMSDPHVLLHDARRLEQSATLGARLRLRHVRVPMMGE